MGMSAVVMALPAEEYRALRRLAEHDDSSYVTSYVTQLLDLQRSPVVEVLDVDKMWDALNRILTGHGLDEVDTLDPILGGEPVGEDLGYGPARFLDPERVAEVADAGADRTKAACWARFDPAAFHAAGVYPRVWDRADEEADLRRELGDLVDAATAFYAAAASRGDGMVLLLT